MSDHVKITGVELIPVSLPWKKVFKIREETIASTDSVLLKIYTDSDIVGIGDSGNTSPWYRGETQASIMAMIAEVIFPAILSGEDPTRIEKIVARMDFLVKDNNQAKALVDYALHDIKGKLYGVPVYELLGGRSVEAVESAYVMSASTIEDAVQVAHSAVTEGFRMLKMKTGGVELSEDIARVSAVREAIGDDIELWVDVNGAWRYDEAVKAIRALEPYNLARIEQPLPPGDFDGMARLRSMVPTPIWADETAQELNDITELVRRQAADGLFIKVPKAGGLLRSQRWITLAQAAGLAVMCGCMAGSGLEAAEYTHLLTASAWASQFVHENIGPIQVHDVFNTVDTTITDDIALEVPRYSKGYTYPMEGPGLGITLNEDVVSRIVTKDKAAVSAGTVPKRSR